ncbi:hypothetical protein V498_01893 [Pseudogymnoascus sp. VKM F-4517 (FW-2822)]|nr:hypothetical protein V498_01893 [Pseudogymnoascus sp. VKM F-4517 (FW-2822)]
MHATRHDTKKTTLISKQLCFRSNQNDWCKGRQAEPSNEDRLFNVSSAASEVFVTRDSTNLVSANIRTTGDETKPPGYNPCRENNSRGRNEAYVERTTTSSHDLQDSRSERDYQATENDTTTCNPRVNSDEESSSTLVAAYFDAADYGSPIGHSAHAHQMFPQAESMAVDRSLSSSLPPFISEPSLATKSPRAHVVSSSAGVCDARLDLPTNSSSIFSTSERASTDDVMLLSSTDSGAQFQCHAALESSEQARLFRLFIDTWGPGLDATDSKRHFTYDIPHRALTTPVLLNAMLSIASLQESKILKSDSLIAEQYYEESVGLLIRLLGHSSIVTDEVLLATTVILRIYEQMNVPVYSNDNERHLHGSSALVSTYPSTNSTLRRAAFYIYLRQDVYMAIVAQRLVKVELPCCSQPPPASDSEWSNLIVLIVAKIVNFCFAKDSERSSRRWSDLREVADEWNAKRPNTFDPYYYRERNIFEGRYFPDVWLSAQWHVTGNLYSHLGQVLLSIYDPNIRVGIGALRQQKILQV